MEPTDLASWPKAPKPGTPLPHDGMEPASLAKLRSLDWDPIDVRGMPVENMKDREQAVLAWLHGVRLGTILPDSKKARMVEVEARACGLMAAKTARDDKPKLLGDDLDRLLDFGKVPAKVVARFDKDK